MAKLIEKQTVNEYVVRIIKNDKPIFGGFYQTELVLKNRVINFVDGLNLEASYEVYRDTVKAILIHKLSNANGTK